MDGDCWIGVRFNAEQVQDVVVLGHQPTGTIFLLKGQNIIRNMEEMENAHTHLIFVRQLEKKMDGR